MELLGNQLSSFSPSHVAMWVCWVVSARSIYTPIWRVEPWPGRSGSAGFWFNLWLLPSLFLRQWLLPEGSQTIFVSTNQLYCNNGIILHLICMQMNQVIGGKNWRYFSFLVLIPYFIWQLSSREAYTNVRHHRGDIFTEVFSDYIIHRLISSEVSWRTDAP